MLRHAGAEVVAAEAEGLEEDAAVEGHVRNVCDGHFEVIDIIGRDFGEDREIGGEAVVGHVLPSAGLIVHEVSIVQTGVHVIDRHWGAVGEGGHVGRRWEARTGEPDGEDIVEGAAHELGVFLAAEAEVEEQRIARRDAIEFEHARIVGGHAAHRCGQVGIARGVRVIGSEVAHRPSHQGCGPRGEHKAFFDLHLRRPVELPHGAARAVHCHILDEHIQSFEQLCHIGQAQAIGDGDLGIGRSCERCEGERVELLHVAWFGVVNVAAWADPPRSLGEPRLNLGE